MQVEKPAGTRGLPLWAIAVGGIAVAVSYAGLAILQISDTLPGEVLAALKPIEERGESESGTIAHIDGVPTGVWRGIQLGLLSLLFGGVPVAILGRILAARPSFPEKRWSRTWGSVFLAGFVFQLSSVVFSAGLLGLFFWAVAASAVTAQEIVESAGPLLYVIVVAICGIWGVRSWRVLQRQVHDTPVTIAPHDRPRSQPL